MRRKLLQKQSLIIAAGILVFSVTALGCQNTETHSDTAKLQKILAMYSNYAQEFPLVEGITVEELLTIPKKTKRLNYRGIKAYNLMKMLDITSQNQNEN